MNAPLRFPAAARLRRSAEFHKLKKEGRSFHGKLMVLSVLAIADGGPARAGFITSRRVGGAVERNRVRRRLREIVRTSRPHLRTGFWFVVIARAAAVKATFLELHAEWSLLARRAELLSA